MPRLAFTGAAISTKLVESITDISMSFQVEYPTGWDFAQDFVVVMDPGIPVEEKILCDSISGNIVTIVERGYDNTSPHPHNAGAIVRHVLSANVIEEVNGHVYNPFVHTREYIHIQSIPSGTWTIDHNLNGNPQVILEDSLNRPFLAEISRPTLNQVIVTLNPPTAGKATVTL